MENIESTLGIVFPQTEKDLLQEMFDRTAEILSDDILEIYIIEKGPDEGKPLPIDALKYKWLADLYALESLSIKLGINFDLKETKRKGERYLSMVTPPPK